MQYTSEKRFPQRKTSVKSGFISGFSELDELGDQATHRLVKP